MSTTKKSSKRAKTPKKEDVEMKAEVPTDHDDKKNRARVRLHGVDNSATFEHPASFAAEIGKLDPSSLKHF